MMDSGTPDDLVIPIHRFIAASSRYSPEDQVIDLTICLEALLLPEKQAEMMYRFALRGAYLLAPDFEKEDMRKFLKDVYSARSMIVHGGRRLPRNASEKKSSKFTGLVLDDVPRVWEVARIALLKIVLANRSGQRLQSVIAALEGAVLHGGPPPYPGVGTTPL